MQFAYPHVLWSLLVLMPALVAFFWWALRSRQRLAERFIQARLLPGLLHGVSPARQKFRMGCIVLAVFFVILALARPQWGFDWEEVKQRGLDIVVAIDTSKSMLAEDIAPNRLGRAKLAALDLMQQARSDRLGVVAFAGRAFLQCPLTIDDTVFRQSVEALDVNTIPQGGTALAEAIRIARTAFKESDNYKVLVMFTDGEDNDQGAVETAQAAAKEGMRIFTVGVGTSEGELLRITDGKDRTDYIRDEQGNVVKSHLNEALLQEIAQATEGGFYLPLRGAKTIDTLYERGLAPLPRSDQGVRRVKHYHERYHWPLAAAILLLMAEMLLPERRRRRKQAEQPARPGRALRTAATATLLLVTASVASGSPSKALHEYQSGNYDAALKDYQQALERKADDPRLHFNAGASAYRDRQYNEAAKYFGQALTAPDLQLQQQAYYNLGNTLYRLGEDLQDTKKRMETWQESVKRYESALKLNPADDDAKFNYEFVKKKLEEQKEQEQQQQDQNKQDKNQDQKKDQQQQGGQQDKDQKQDQQKQDQQNKQDQQGDGKSDQQKDQQGQPKPEDQKKDPQQPAKSDKGEKPDQDKEPQPPEGRADMRPMTPQEARQMLDAQKGDEQVLQLRPPGKPEDQQRRLKDW